MSFLHLRNIWLTAINPISRIGDLARSGHLPAFLCAGLSGSHPIDLNSHTTSRIPTGIIAGIDDSWKEAIVAAYPDWNLLFASRRRGADTIARDAVRLNAFLIFGPHIKRKHIQAADYHRLDILRINPSPLPRLSRPPDENNRTEFARGFVIESNDPWTLARRTNKMEYLAESPMMAKLEKAAADAKELRRILDARFSAARNRGTLTMSHGKAAIGQSDPTSNELFFKLPELSDWASQISINEFEDVITKADSVTSDPHPLAVTALLLGRRIEVDSHVLFSRLLHKSNLNSENQFDQLRTRLIISAVFWSARYAHENRLVDPLEFLQDKAESRQQN